MSTRVTAMDVEQQEFPKKLRGYDPDEVHLYLESVAEEIERLNLENGKMAEEAGQLRTELGELRTREQTLQKTLVTAQRMTEEMKDKARTEGELVVREAQFRADQILKEARNQLAQIESDVSRSKTERETFERQLRGVAEQFLAMLDMREQARGPDNVHRMPDRVKTEVG